MEAWLTAHSTTSSMCTSTFHGPWGKQLCIAKDAKHVRQSAKVEPASRVWCLKIEHHGPSCNMHSQHTTTNAQPLLIFYAAAPKSRAV